MIKNWTGAVPLEWRL